MAECLTVAENAENFHSQLAALEAEFKRLEVEYTQYFAGRLQRPPSLGRSRVQAMLRQLDRTHLSNYGDRFKFSAVQSRVAKSFDLWDRALRAREEGRSGPFSHGHPARFIEKDVENKE